ncbi:UDP-N-acetylmuramate--L-alanine ligase [Hymenobacter psychrophilus]|uniref:UDP-N-acetylmuramate--L-alanine ligase n=1 Tax=Hymenobacter psychrophilus TaxID=651662 RepID=A0A1H3IUV8_9BACT|nr:Mur ligase family protein [Hymenobacter psychrophilus]SDY31480.1 UDP-N-acetylmuramate--L-alanine ligase [Hymenobacter psychrophilus]
MKSNVFFLGIGGIGMSALARWFQANGHVVSGYDKTRTPLTAALTAEGISIHYDDAVESIPLTVRENPADTLVVLTPAIPKDHREWAWLREQGYDIRKRSQVLGVLTEGRPTIAVAGTHGKTTTSSMVAHLLHHAGVPCAAFLGGISVNLGSNLLVPESIKNEKSKIRNSPEGVDNDTNSQAPEANNEQQKTSNENDLTTDNGQLVTRNIPVVVEADEYDRSFLTLFPTVAIVTSTDADHLDIYGDADTLLESFRQFVGQIQPGGTLLINHTADASVAAAAPAGVRVLRYGLSPGQGPELYAANITADGHLFRFDMHGPAGPVPGLELAVPGFHNVENMLAAACVARLYGLTDEQLRAAVAAYRGVKRRFEFIVTAGTPAQPKVYVDDYAHHPREIEAFLQSLRALYPGRRLRVVFQPHLYSRTRDFAPGFAESLSLADEVVLLDIYPAREQPLPGVTAELILSQITAPVKSLQTKAEILQNAETNPNFDVLATVGAGDIDQLVPQLRNILNLRWQNG